MIRFNFPLLGLIDGAKVLSLQWIDGQSTITVRTAFRFAKSKTQLLFEKEHLLYYEI